MLLSGLFLNNQYQTIIEATVNFRSINIMKSVNQKTLILSKFVVDVCSSLLSNSFFANTYFISMSQWHVGNQYHLQLVCLDDKSYHPTSNLSELVQRSIFTKLVPHVLSEISGYLFHF